MGRSYLTWLLKDREDFFVIDSDLCCFKNILSNSIEIENPKT